MCRICLLLVLLLAACNLQQQPPTPTAQPTEADLDAPIDASPIPPAQTTPLPSLQPTPTQITLVTATLAPLPTPFNFSSVGPGQPTLDPALADERYEIQVRDGATIGVNYEVIIGARGTVSMALQGPDGLVWQQVFTASETGRAEVEIEQGGTYEILVNRESLDGSYSVSWD